MRECGSCSLCCKLPGVYTLPDQQPTISKPINTWCEHCDKGNGCRIYETRPSPCINFDCLWLVHPEMGEALRPDRSHVIMYGLSEEDKANFNCDVIVMEDPAYFGFKESSKNETIAAHVRTMMASGLRVTIINGEQGHAISSR